MFLGGKILWEIIKPESTDIVSYPVLKEKYGTTVQVAMVIDWIDEETLRVLTFPEKEIRRVKSSLILRIIKQDEIKGIISSIAK
jgi:hypothetical protein